MIGREQERKELQRRYQRNKAEFIVVYGRRRVGKTFLIDETFEGMITFRHAGMSPVEKNKKGELTRQLESFYYTLQRYQADEGKCPESWMEAFFLLEKWLEKTDRGDRQIVFLDELPWMDTPRSGFVSALENFWNNWGGHRKNLMLIVCGSASSWILDHLINNHGGLYNRITCRIKLSPFTLRECEQFYESISVRMTRYDIVQSYMILGGIPYYMDYFHEDSSFAQNIDRLFFAKQPVLQDEYDRLFTSSFSNPDTMKAIISLLNTRRTGYTRNEIAQKLDFTSGGTLSKCLKALVGSDYVSTYVPFGMKKGETYYKLTDAFCLFYLYFSERLGKPDYHYWLHHENTPAIIAWRGLAFENVCFQHIDQIKKALGIFAVCTSQSAWTVRGDDTDGTQIDLLIDRDDRVMNMCEIKFLSQEFSVGKSYHRILTHRRELLSEAVSPKTVVHSTLITTYGLKRNEYSGFFSSVVAMEDLFAEV